MPHVYIVQCADGSYYVGSTWHLEQRIWQHNHDPFGPAYTRRRRPVRLVWAEHFDRVADAFAAEKQIQGWSRAKREALIHDQLELLPDLASRPSTRRRPAAEP